MNDIKSLADAIDRSRIAAARRASPLEKTLRAAATSEALADSIASP